MAIFADHRCHPYRLRCGAGTCAVVSGREERGPHTGGVVTEEGAYVFEGHVPAEHVMEIGERKDYHQVLLLKRDGSSSVFAHANQSRK